jgi:PAS domain S-box-containing protein
MSAAHSSFIRQLLDPLLEWWLPDDSDEIRWPTDQPEADLRAGYRLQRRRLHAEKIPLTYSVFLGFGAFATGLEFISYPERRRPMLLAFALFAFVCIAVIAAVRRLPRRVTAVAVIGSNALILCTAGYYVRAQGVPEACALTLALFIVTLPLLNAAGPRVQILSCVGALVGYPLVLLLGSQPSLPVAYGVTAILGATAVSVLGAYLPDRQRYAAFCSREKLRANQERLRSASERYRLLYDHNPAMYFMVETDGTVRSVNRFGAEQLGYSTEELVGLPVSTVFFAADRDDIRLQLERCVQHPGEVAHWEGRKVRKDGSILWVKELARTVRDADGRTLVFIVCEDITERKQAEEAARRHQAELAHVARVRLIGEMAASLAHEINQPLGAIVNFTRGCELRLRERDGVEPEMLYTLEQVSAQALRASEIIRGIRDFIRKEEPRFAWIDVNQLAQNVAQLAEPDARQNGIRLQLGLAPGVPKVYANGIEIEQVLLNLVRNGLDAMDVEAAGEKTLSIRTAANGDKVEMTVSDTGTGLAPDLLNRIFDPFFTTKASGLGLGLSISRSIIEAHGGRLWAEPNPAGGSTFRFWLATKREA